MAPDATPVNDASVLTDPPEARCGLRRTASLGWKSTVPANRVRRGRFAWGRYRQSLQDWAFGGTQTQGIHLRWLPWARVEIPFRDCPCGTASRSANPTRRNGHSRPKPTSQPPPDAHRHAMWTRSHGTSAAHSQRAPIRFDGESNTGPIHHGTHPRRNPSTTTLIHHGTHPSQRRIRRGPHRRRHPFAPTRPRHNAHRAQAPGPEFDLYRAFPVGELYPSPR